MISFLSRNYISIDDFNILNSVAGYHFDNDNLQIDFRQLFNSSEYKEDLVFLKLDHIGIEAYFYVSESEIRRFLGVEIKYLDADYVAHIVTRNCANYGVHYIHFIPWELSRKLPTLVSAYLILGEWQVKVLVEVNSLELDKNYLFSEKNRLSKDLKLVTAHSPFETYLDSHELSVLCADDVVLVYPK
ncbi:putative dimethyladenosine transferase [Vibrio aestuarianus]|uniref:hypothetical protein n=1 Tax=Vibrio aestuarianus TaxID=28171 RepID=UPI0014561BA9|nr:hypothetical protein [Vibrio aestuarianus]NLS66473.1 hypothetical protein [Vibrio aestuarianus subsp. francensis]CAH8233004.1 putative dimethyladenosine transferase [Vibrio aestuarianus]